ncbi:hypothetical protein M9H77_04356 [Catharanthus roseus]|uniref:Uncharacterized protein n=1 Tax=Catharanthus roseus TaxID=4058 RepID=A0ACC0CEE8_CATRO|nr:hypothetical protein M9H77_04356 [Catharanthus roseus]
MKKARVLVSNSFSSSKTCAILPYKSKSRSQVLQPPPPDTFPHQKFEKLELLFLYMEKYFVLLGIKELIFEKDALIKASSVDRDLHVVAQIILDSTFGAANLDSYSRMGSDPEFLIWRRWEVLTLRPLVVSTVHYSVRLVNGLPPLNPEVVAKVAFSLR